MQFCMRDGGFLEELSKRRWRLGAFSCPCCVLFLLSGANGGAEAEAAAAEGIDGAENNNTDKRPGAARFHLFVYHISRMELNKVPLEICGVSWDVTAPPPGCRVFPCCWRWRNWDRISPPHDLNVSAARVRLIPQSFGKWSVCRSQLSSSQDSESRDGNHLLPQPTGIFFFSLFCVS